MDIFSLAVSLYLDQWQLSRFHLKFLFQVQNNLGSINRICGISYVYTTLMHLQFKSIGATLQGLKAEMYLLM